jgi:ferredoxin
MKSMQIILQQQHEADVQFNCLQSETLAQAALRQHIALPFACQNGNCGVCETELLEGCVISPQTRVRYAKGSRFLSCQCCPLSDLRIQLKRPYSALQQESVIAQISSVTELDKDWLLLKLNLPAGRRKVFFAGQSALLAGQVRSPFQFLAHDNDAPTPREVEFIVPTIWWLRYREGQTKKHIPLTSIKIKYPFNPILTAHSGGIRSFMQAKGVAGAIDLPLLKVLTDWALASADAEELKTLRAILANPTIQDQLIKSGYFKTALSTNADLSGTEYKTIDHPSLIT